MSARLPHATATAEFHPRGMAELAFWNLAADAGHRHLRQRQCRLRAREAPDLDGGTLVVSQAASGRRRLWIYSFDGAVGLVSIRGEDGWIVVAADSEAGARELSARIRAAVAEPPLEDGRVAVAFWTAGDHGGAVRSTRRLAMPAWSEVAGNYPAALADRLAPVLAAQAPAPGPLLLWHGPPGTGKTTALRALAQAWRPWAAVDYVVDPERFFGSAGYMTEVLTDRADSERATLLVLEDAGELIAPDARMDAGQGLSRLLNLTDGMLGQGLDVVVLITTNEPVSRLHPAAARPGRCWAEIEFAEHSREDANRWLAASGCEVRVSRATPLAELFAIAAGAGARGDRAFGFG